MISAMSSFLRYSILTGLFGVLFVPFIVANGFFFPFITGKAFAFRIVVEIVFALWIVLALKDSSVRPRGSVLLYTLLALIVSMGVSTILAENPSKSFWSNFERMEGYISLLHFGAYFLVTSSMLQAQNIWRTFWNTSIGVSIALGLYGVLQLAGVFTINQGGVRVDATFGNATYLAVYMLFHFFITLIALVEWKPKKYFQLFYGVALVLQTLMIFYTATRGTILGLVGGLFLSGILFVIFAKGQNTLRKAGAIIAIAVVVISGAFFLAKDSGIVQNSDVLRRIASISLEEGETRFTIWGIAWQGFLERPVFGWGQENFNYVFNTYYEPSLYAQEPWFDRAHNIFFDWLVAGGIIALVLYLSLFVVALWYMWKPRNPFEVGERVLLTGLLAGYGFHNLFVFDNLISYIFFLSILSYIVVKNMGERKGGGPTFGNSTVSVASVVVGIALIGTLYVANVPGMARASGLIASLRPYEAGLTENFAHFKKVVQGGGIGRQEVHEQLLQFASRIRTQELASFSTQEFRDEVALFAIERFDEEVTRTPNDARLQIFFGSFLRQLGVYDLAEEHIVRAQELSPRKPSILFERAVLSADQGDMETALIYFKEAYELEPQNEQALSFYAATAIRAGKAELADSLLLEQFGTVDIVDPYILQAYIDTGNTSRIVMMAETRVRENPENLQNYLELASSYLQVNRRLDAISTLEKAIAFDPSFETQGQYYIDEIRAGRNP